jgi:hypothetical protein
VSANQFGCASREHFQKIIEYAAQKDSVAVSNALGVAVVNGDCVLFKADEPVFLSDTAIFSGLVKVRRPGDTQEYWTNIEAVSTGKRPTAASATSAATPSPERPNQTTIENDLRLAKIGTNLQKLGVAAIARGQRSDDPAVKLQALVESAADEIVGCEVWSSMASTTTPDMDDVCKQERSVMNSLPPETQAAIQRQMVVVRTELGEGRYPQ